jgi:hypothetical protein
VLTHKDAKTERGSVVSAQRKRQVEYWIIKFAVPVAPNSGRHVARFLKHLLRTWRILAVQLIKVPEERKPDVTTSTPRPAVPGAGDNHLAAELRGVATALESFRTTYARRLAWRKDLPPLEGAGDVVMALGKLAAYLDGPAAPMTDRKVG